MWMLDNTTAYAADRNWTRDEHGRHHWLVAVRATFIADAQGKLTLADEQLPPALLPEYSGKPGESSLRWDSDLIYRKPVTDVIVEANAHAPEGRACEAMLVSLRLGPIDKQLVVHGPRAYVSGGLGLTTTGSQPFVSQPITYEWAFGGTDALDPDPRRQGLDERNPVGKGFAVVGDHLLGHPAHVIEHRGSGAREAGPAGFGPIDPGWQPRRRRAGTPEPGRPLLPRDYDELFACCAPDDQRPPHHLRGGESAELLGMTRTGVWRFELPKLYFTYTTFFGRRREEHRSKLVTVFLQPEEQRVSLTWQTSLLVAANEIDYLDVTEIEEKPYLR